jgi:hypothetical protein
MRPSIIAMVLVLSALGACAEDAATGPMTRSDLAPSSDVSPGFPGVIQLPNGFSPEGIAFGAGTTFYVASLNDGSIFRGDARTGAGAVFIPGRPDRSGCGVRYDARGNRLFVAGSFTGQAYVYDATTGATLAVYQLADPTAGVTSINDMVVLEDAVYLTDDSRPVIYRIPLGPGGALPPQSAVQTIPLTGDFQFTPGGVNGNGIIATPDEKKLIIDDTFGESLYLVDPQTGHATTIDLGGKSLLFADGLIRIGRTFYVVQGPFNQIAVVRFSEDFASGVLDQPLTDPDLNFPSAIAPFGDALYAVNARFDVAPGPTVQYQVVRVQRR